MAPPGTKKAAVKKLRIGLSGSRGTARPTDLTVKARHDRKQSNMGLIYKTESHLGEAGNSPGKLKAEIGLMYSDSEISGAEASGAQSSGEGRTRIVSLPHGVCGDDAEILLLVKEPRMNWLNVFKHRRLGSEAGPVIPAATDEHFSVFDKTKLKGAKEKARGGKIVVFDSRVPELVNFVSKHCSRMLKFSHEHDTRPDDLDGFLRVFRYQTCVRIASNTHVTIGNTRMTLAEIRENAHALIKQLETSPNIIVQFVIVETASGERTVVYDRT